MFNQRGIYFHSQLERLLLLTILKSREYKSLGL